MGEVYGLPRHLFDEETIDEWAERRGVLVKAIEDAALAWRASTAASACRCRRTMPMAREAHAPAFARPARARTCRSTS